MKIASACVLLILIACGSNDETPGGSTDARASDAQLDASGLDARSPDASGRDSEVLLDAELVDQGDANDASDVGFEPDTAVERDSGADDATPADSGEISDVDQDATVTDSMAADAEAVDAAPPDGGTLCDPSPCFPGVECLDTGAAFECGECPVGYAGDGQTCDDFDACSSSPCLPGSTCTDHVAPDPLYSCSPCEGTDCPVLRALAGPDQEVLSGSRVLLEGSATGNNGAYSCSWTNDQDSRVLFGCVTTATVSVETELTLEVIDASGTAATDTLIVRIVPLVADAGPDQNILSGDTATLIGSWSGASCADSSCISCEWRDSAGTVVATTCTATASPSFTTQYALSIVDGGAGVSAADSMTVFVIDAPANLCGWDVVVLTSGSYPTASNPNYTCTPDGRARRQRVNGKPSIVLSDLVVQNSRIIGYIDVETGSDDDLIGFLWGFENPAHTYLLSWKQATQGLGGVCGNALSGIAVKKVDAPSSAATGISYNTSFGFLATNYVYTCADGWSTDRNNQALLSPGTTFLRSPRDAGAFTTGWRDFITYRFEIYSTATRSKVLLFEDEARNGSTDGFVTELEIVDSSFPRGRVAFFSNSQEQVDFGDFTFASLDGFEAEAGPDQAVTLGTEVTLEGAATLAVPPIRCSWTENGMQFAGTCTATAAPTLDSVYRLTVTDAFDRETTDELAVTVTP